MPYRAADGQPLDQPEEEHRQREHERQAQQEEEHVDGRPREAHGRRRDGQEGRDGGACGGTVSCEPALLCGLQRLVWGRGRLRTLVAELAVFLHAAWALLLFHVFRGGKVGCVQ